MSTIYKRPTNSIDFETIVYLHKNRRTKRSAGAVTIPPVLLKETGLSVRGCETVCSTMRRLWKGLLVFFVAAWILYFCLNLTIPRKRSIIQVSRWWEESVQLMQVSGDKHSADNRTLKKSSPPPLQPNVYENVPGVGPLVQKGKEQDKVVNSPATMRSPVLTPTVPLQQSVFAANGITVPSQGLLPLPRDMYAGSDTDVQRMVTPVPGQLAVNGQSVFPFQGSKSAMDPAAVGDFLREQYLRMATHLADMNNVESFGGPPQGAVNGGITPLPQPNLRDTSPGLLHVMNQATVAQNAPVQQFAFPNTGNDMLNNGVHDKSATTNGVSPNQPLQYGQMYGSTMPDFISKLKSLLHQNERPGSQGAGSLSFPLQTAGQGQTLTPDLNNPMQAQVSRLFDQLLSRYNQTLNGVGSDIFEEPPDYQYSNLSRDHNGQSPGYQTFQNGTSGQKNKYSPGPSKKEIRLVHQIFDERLEPPPLSVDDLTGPWAVDTTSSEKWVPLDQAYRDLHQKYLTRYFIWKGMNARVGLGVRHFTRMTEIEKRILALPALTNVTHCAEELTSSVYLLTHRPVHRVGDKIQVRVDLYDQLGRRRTSGGDEVRMWLKGSSHSAPAMVTDLGNGSYIGEATLRWEGKTTVAVSLTYSREFLRLAVELRQGLLSTRWIVAHFADEASDVSEVTPCLPSYPIPGYADTCNLTLRNGLLPWYCGQPTVAPLTCDHWSKTLNLPFFAPLPLTGPAWELNQMMNAKGDPERLIPNKITIVTAGSPQTPPPLPPCFTRPAKESWQETAQLGWLRQGEHWIPDRCALPTWSVDYAEKCVQDRQVVILGDSNAREMFITLAGQLGQLHRRGAWHWPLQSELPWLNSSLLFAPHARPFNTGLGTTGVIAMSMVQALRHLPPHENYVIVLHYWLHFGFYPLSVFRDRVRLASQAVKAFLHDHPTAKVAVRGPHVVYKGQGHHAQFGDKFGRWYREIIMEEFTELQDRVWYLDIWPLSIASQNHSLHPPANIVVQMWRVLFGYICQQS